jgi:hypothetical protein
MGALIGSASSWAMTFTSLLNHRWCATQGDLEDRLRSAGHPLRAFDALSQDWQPRYGDPPKLHGPYWFWTRKVNVKTVSRVQNAEQTEDYKPWFENELVRESEQLSIDVADEDTRWPKRS